MSVPIGELAARHGLSVDAIRYYERAGVLPPPERNSGGQRRYSENDSDALAVVCALRDAGFTIEQIRGVVAVKAAGGDARERIGRMRQQIADLIDALDAQQRAVERARKLLTQWEKEMDDWTTLHDQIGVSRDGAHDV